MLGLVLAMSASVTTLLAGLGGALIGGGAALTGTWWEHRVDRRATAADDFRRICQDVNVATNDLLHRFKFAQAPDRAAAVERAFMGLSNATAELALYPISDEDLNQSIDELWRTAEFVAAAQSYDAALGAALKVKVTPFIVAARKVLPTLL